MNTSPKLSRDLTTWTAAQLCHEYERALKAKWSTRLVSKRRAYTRILADIKAEADARGGV